MNVANLDHFQVIADASRRRMLFLLSKEGQTINSLAENFNMSRPAVSKHIQILYNTGFISIEDMGRERFCTLKQEGFRELEEWLSYYNTFWIEKVTKLNMLLNKQSRKEKDKKKRRRF